MTSYLTQPFSDMTGPVYDALNQNQGNINANTEAAAQALATAQTTVSGNLYGTTWSTDVANLDGLATSGYLPWRDTFQFKAAKALIAEKALADQAVLLAVKTAIDLVLANQVDKRMRDIASDQMELANRQMNMGEELHVRYIGKFAPLEDAVADFAKTDWEANRYKPQYALQQGRAKLDAARAFSKVAAKINKKFTRYCTGANANMIRQTHTDWARMEVDMTNRAWRDEEARMWARDEVQWVRMQNAISNGQRLPSQSSIDVANGVRAATESNAVRGQAMQGWYGAISRAGSSWFNFGYGAVEQSKAIGYSQLPQLANTMYPTGNSVGSLGTPGMTTDVNVGQITGGQVQETNLGYLGGDAAISDVPQIASNIG